VQVRHSCFEREAATPWQMQVQTRLRRVYSFFTITMPKLILKPYNRLSWVQIDKAPRAQRTKTS
jgi:hypothetical protein